MESTNQFQRLAADMLHECPVLCEKLGLDGLAHLATCSEALKKNIDTVLVRDSLGLLDFALDTARQSRWQQPKQAVAWLAAILLRKAPALAVDVTERLLRIPSMILPTAEQLVAAGVRVTYAQLLAAAESMVAGVEVWVEAQQRLDVHTDIPALATAICCGKDWVSDGCTHSGGLQLAVCLQGCWCAKPQQMICARWLAQVAEGFLSKHRLACNEYSAGFLRNLVVLQTSEHCLACRQQWTSCGPAIQ
jgi:hypothetical protein